jgi:hypothetical protein
VGVVEWGRLRLLKVSRRAIWPSLGSATCGQISLLFVFLTNPTNTLPWDGRVPQSNRFVMTA